MSESVSSDHLSGLRVLLKRLLRNEDVPEQEANLLKREIARLEKCFHARNTRRPGAEKPGLSVDSVDVHSVGIIAMFR